MDLSYFRKADYDSLYALWMVDGVDHCRKCYTHWDLILLECEAQTELKEHKPSVGDFPEW